MLSDIVYNSSSSWCKHFEYCNNRTFIEVNTMTKKHVKTFAKYKEMVFQILRAMTGNNFESVRAIILARRIN